MAKNRNGKEKRGDAAPQAAAAESGSDMADSEAAGNGSARVDAGAEVGQDAGQIETGSGPADGDGAATAAPAEGAELSEAQLVQDLTAQVTALQNDLLRKQADFENFRKRMNRDKEEAIKFANSSLLLDLTAVIDDFERAISAAEQTKDFTTLHSGIELIEKQLLGTLERKWGLARFDSAGASFDPERHEALATEESAEHGEPTVIEDYQKGYTLHGRVIRAARVRVATPVSSSVAASSDSDGTDADHASDTEQGE